jgi:lactate dehydrogenase-like 2-hydroxyacid dehydrogenase
VHPGVGRIGAAVDRHAKAQASEHGQYTRSGAAPEKLFERHTVKDRARRE